MEGRQLWVVARERSLLNPTMCCLYWNRKTEPMMMNKMMVNDGCHAAQGLLASVMRCMHLAADGDEWCDGLLCFVSWSLTAVLICCADLLHASVGLLLHSASAFFCWWWRQIVIVIFLLFRLFNGNMWPHGFMLFAPGQGPLCTLLWICASLVFSSAENLW